jgi:hypothetical protein
MMHAAIVLLVLATSGFAGSPLRIVAEGDWKASPADVLAVLRSATTPLWREFPDRDLAPIKVLPDGGPIVLYDRGNDGGYTVKLATAGNLWAQYAYQFSHEFCHILCNYKKGGAQNKWFEESLCELASIYSLRRMSEEWKTNPPYPNWKSYSAALHAYAQDLIAKTEVPADLAGWYEANRQALAGKADDRPKNRVLAVRLLPLFEQHPELWGAIAYLNKGGKRNDQDFAAYLQEWHDQAPRQYGPRIAEIAGLLGVKLKD